MTPEIKKTLDLALDLVIMHHTDDGYSELRQKVRHAIKQALAEPVQDNDAHYKGVVEGVQKLFDDKRAQPAPVKEPVAWGIIASNTGRICQVELDADEIEGHNPKHIVPLYTTPPAANRPWVGLTNEEIGYIWAQNQTNSNRFARAIEAKLKEKNHDPM